MRPCARTFKTAGLSRPAVYIARACSLKPVCRCRCVRGAQCRYKHEMLDAVAASPAAHLSYMPSAYAAAPLSPSANAATSSATAGTPCCYPAPAPVVAVWWTGAACFCRCSAAFALVGRNLACFAISRPSLTSSSPTDSNSDEQKPEASSSGARHSPEPSSPPAASRAKDRSRSRSPADSPPAAAAE
jgi:hypothetical protein